MKFYQDYLASHNIVCLNLNLDRASSEQLGRATFPNINKSLKLLTKENYIVEAAILQKCNCVEIYAISRKKNQDDIRDKLISFWKKESPRLDSITASKVKMIKGERVFSHLLQTGCGLKSLNLGDSQVLSQVRDARKMAIEANAVGPVLNHAFSHARHTDQRVRNETRFHNGYSSIERSVIELIKSRFDKNSKIGIIGLGKTGQLLIKALRETEYRHITATNRSNDVLLQLKEKYSVNTRSFESYKSLLLDMDVVIFSTSSPNYLATVHDVVNPNITLIDVSNPPNVDPALSQQINLIDLHFIRRIGDKTMKNRRLEVEKVEKIVDEEIKVVKDKINQALLGRNISNSMKNFELDLDKGKQHAIFVLRNNIFRYARDYLYQNQFIEVQTPAVMTIATDPVKNPKDERFQVSWFGRKAFLRQSIQLHKQIAVIAGFKKIFEIGMFWRAEKRKTKRHLCEAWSLDIEMQNDSNHYRIMKELENLIQSITHNLRTKDKKILKKLGVIIEKAPKHFLKITYDSAIAILQQNKVNISRGEDIGPEREMKLYQILKRKHWNKVDFFFIHDYPNTVKKFYTKQSHDDLTQTFDLIYKGWEITSGAQRETNYTQLIKRMKDSGLDPKKYGFYLKWFKQKKVPEHGGFGLGLDRLVAKLLNQNDVMDVVLFPRTETVFAP